MYVQSAQYETKRKLSFMVKKKQLIELFSNTCVNGVLIWNRKFLKKPDTVKHYTNKQASLGKQCTQRNNYIY